MRMFQRSQLDSPDEALKDWIMREAELQIMLAEARRRITSNITKKCCNGTYFKDEVKKVQT